MTDLIWANSGDAHVLEPPGLWQERLPADLAARMPRSEKIDERTETGAHRWPLLRAQNRAQPGDERRGPGGRRAEGQRAPGGNAGPGSMGRPPGAWDVQLRLKDLDEEGIWGEVVYPSIGLWNGMIKDPVLYREGVGRPTTG